MAVVRAMVVYRDSLLYIKPLSSQASLDVFISYPLYHTSHRCLKPSINDITQASSQRSLGTEVARP